jgi:chromosome partitioning protein
MALQAAGIGTVLIDTPPGHGDIVVAAMRAADLVVVPVKPGEHDLDAALATVAIADSLGRPVVLVPSDATFRSIAMGRTITTLREAGLLTTSPVHHRVNIMLGSGRTVIEQAPASKGAAEIQMAWRTVAHLAAGMSS